MANFELERDFGPKKPDFGLERKDFRSERVDLRLLGLIEPDLGMGGYGYIGGCMDGCEKIHPCVLKDIGPLGPLPKIGFTTELSVLWWRC